MTANPTYREVCGHRTGHAEVVQVTFDNAVVTYRPLLQVFWAMHDPTQVDRQGPDVGDQYRSVIFAHTPRAARHRDRVSREGAAGVPAADRDRDPDGFAARSIPAEDYHQRYYEGNGHTPYCHVFPTDVVEKLGLERDRLAPEPDDLVRGIADRLTP